MSAGTFRMRREAAERAAAEARAASEVAEPKPEDAQEAPATVATADAVKPRPKAPSRPT